MHRATLLLAAAAALTLAADDAWTSFQNPGPDMRGKPFWSWNGRLEKEELLRQLQVFKSMGFGGTFMHSRTGLATRYLGDEWFALINACADASEKLGLEAWLYDEDRWPSGSAGGLVAKEERFRMRSLLLEVKDAAAWKDLAWNDALVAVFEGRVDGLAVSAWKRLRPGDTPDAGKKLLIFRVVLMTPGSFYNGYTYIDTLNPEATARFLELTHEQYRQRCGDRLGRSIKGIFTDEPHRGALLDGFSCSDADGIWRLPWTARLPERFRADFGYDLTERLPELFLKPDGQDVSQVKWHFVETAQRLFIDGYIKPYAAWCEDHHLIFTGHFLHEDSLAAQTAMAGSMMRCYEYETWPGVDVLTEGNRNYWIVKQVASAARQLGRTRILSELYGCTGWQMGFAGHKAVGDWQALLGVNLRCPHLSWYTMEGEAKRDYPASICHHSPWWQDYAAVETYYARINTLMARGTPLCEVLVLNPVESMWCRIHPGFTRHLGATTPEGRALEQGYTDLFHWLMGAQIDFDYGDEGLLDHLAAVEAVDGTPVLRVGKARYRVALVGRMTTMRASTLALLGAFAKAGGRVVFAGDPPAYIDALPSAQAREFARGAVQTALEPTAVVAALDRATSGPCVRVSGDHGQPLPGIFCQARRDGGDTILMALNTDRGAAVDGARIRIRAVGTVEQWDGLRSTRHAVAATATDGALEFATSFAPAGERLFVIRAQADATVPPMAVQATTERSPCAGPYAYRLSEANVCVLDAAAWRLDEGAWHEAVEILKADQAMRDQLGLAHRGGEMLQPWFVEMRSGGTPPVKGRVALRYAFDIAVMPITPVELVMERPALWSISINGRRIDPITAQGWWVDKVMERLPIPAAALRPGANIIELAGGFHAGTNPEAVFLLGSFGVDIAGQKRAITSLPNLLAVGDLARQHLPFYSGSVVYQVPVAAAPAAGTSAVLTLPGVAGACAKVGAPGMAPIIVPWPPYEADITALLAAGATSLEVEVVLTRRNSFGPLHEFPPNPHAVGPGNFLTGGSHFREECVLVATGLTATPVIELRR